MSSDEQCSTGRAIGSALGVGGGRPLGMHRDHCIGLGGGPIGHENHPQALAAEPVPRELLPDPRLVPWRAHRPR